MDMNKTILTGIIIVLVAVIGVIAVTSGGEEQVTNETGTTSGQVADQTNDQSDSATSSDEGDQDNLQTYTNSEYGFSFAYPEDAEVRAAGYGNLYLEKEGVVNWVELPETYPHPTRSNAEMHYKILIKEGVHESPGPAFDEFTAVKSKNGQSFTIQYVGSSNDYPESVPEAFSTVSESFRFE